MKSLITVNSLNVFDSITTSYLLSNPNNIRYEINPLIRFLFINIGFWVFALKIFSFYIFSKWYHRNYSNTKYYKTGMAIPIILFSLFIIINIISIINGKVI